MTFVETRRRILRRRTGAQTPLGYYRFYLLDIEGKVFSAASTYCDDDIAALDRAPIELQRSAFYPLIEIWHGQRFVGRIGRGMTH